MLLSVLTPALDGEADVRLPEEAVRGVEVERVVVRGVSPVGRARNECLAKAHGDYVAWVDADDEVEEGWLEAIRDAVADGADVVVFGCREPDPVEAAFSHAMWDVVARREVLSRFRFDEVSQREDNLFLLGLLTGGVRWKSVPERRYRYVRHEGSQVSRPRLAADSALFIRRSHRVDGLSDGQCRRVDEECLKELCAWVANHGPEAGGWRTVRDAFDEAVDRRGLKAHWRVALRFGHAGVRVMMRLCSMKGMFG